MPTIRLETYINAPRALVFDLCRDVNVHCRTTWWTDERIVEPLNKSMLELGDRVTFEAVHFGVRQKLTSKVTEFQLPSLIVDVMQKGAFKSLKHRHQFIAEQNGTMMIDMLTFESPLGVLGKLANWLVLERYMKNFLVRRNMKLKVIAEAAAKDIHNDEVLN